MIGLLLVVCLLWLSDRFQWFGFNHHKGWTVLRIAATAIASLTLGLAVVHAQTTVDQGQPTPNERSTEPQLKPLQLDVTSRHWKFDAQGPWQDVPDPRGLRAMRYPWHVSTTGEYAELSRAVAIPTNWRPPYILTFFCSDDYSNWPDRPKSTVNSIDCYPGHRFKQVLVDGHVVWKRHMPTNRHPAQPTDFAVDITSLVKPGKKFIVALRNVDRIGLSTNLPTDFYLRGIYELDRPDGNHVLATSCYWGDVMLWPSGMGKAEPRPRPTSAMVQSMHAQGLALSAGQSSAHLPAILGIEGIGGTLPAATPVICGVPLPEGAVKKVDDLAIELGSTPHCLAARSHEPLARRQFALGVG